MAALFRVFARALCLPLSLSGLVFPRPSATAAAEIRFTIRARPVRKIGSDRGRARAEEGQRRGGAAAAAKYSINAAIILITSRPDDAAAEEGEEEER